jgi:hypothetical protein
MEPRSTTPSPSPRSSTPGGASRPEPTSRIDAFELLGALADKAFALEQNERGAGLVGPYLHNILKGAREGGPVTSEMSEFVAKYAVKAGAATGDPSWFDVALELFTLLKAPLPATAVDDLATVRPRLALNRPALRRYVDALRSSVVRFDAAERLLVQRIAALDAP